MDPVQFLSQPPILAGEQYLVHANVSEPTILQCAMPEMSILTGLLEIISNCPKASRRRSLPWLNGSPRSQNAL